MPRLVRPHLWVQRGPRGRQALERVFLFQHRGPFCGLMSDPGCDGASPAVTVCGWGSWVMWGQVCPAILGGNYWFQGGTCPGR